MAIITWKDCYATGINAFDSEHMELVTRINSLYEVIRNKESEQQVSAIINDLLNYTEEHFSHEEQQMKDHQYPGLAEQLEAHAALRNQVAEFNEQLGKGDPQLPAKLFAFLREWLLQHIVEVDRRYGDFFKERGLD